MTTALFLAALISTFVGGTSWLVASAHRASRKRQDDQERQERILRLKAIEARAVAIRDREAFLVAAQARQEAEFKDRQNQATLIMAEIAQANAARNMTERERALMWIAGQAGARKPV